jgi:hypothetical protein
MMGKHEERVLTGYRFSQKEIARHRCIDCGVNVIRIGDYCMISSAIWQGRFGLGWSDNLCIACIEKRLGRPLSLARGDFSTVAWVEGFPLSEILKKRFGGDRRRRQLRRAKGGESGGKRKRKGQANVVEIPIIRQ